MTWWLEGAISRHFGWVRNPQEAIFYIFLESGKKSKKKFFQEKSVFIGKIGDFSPIFFFRFFHCKIFSKPNEIRFFSEKSANFGDFFVPNCKSSTNHCGPFMKYPRSDALEPWNLASVVNLGTLPD